MASIETKLVIIGSGPAGFSAAIYAARAALEPILICGNTIGGQLITTTDVENYPGFASTIQGPWLMEQMEAQARHVGAKIVYDYVNKVDLKNGPFKVICDSGNIYSAASIIIATGAEAKWLGIESEKEDRGFGVSGCATCDGFFFKNKEVVVIGGGNTAVEEALYLSLHASKVTVIHRRNEFRAEMILQERLFKNPKISIVWDTILKEVLGTTDPKCVTGLKLENINTNTVFDMNVDGVFIAIGHKPSTELFFGQIDIDKEGYIITKPDSTQTNIPGVFAAGDVQDKIYRQAVTAAGTGCMAALEAAWYINAL